MEVVRGEVDRRDRGGRWIGEGWGDRKDGKEYVDGRGYPLGNVLTSCIFYYGQIHYFLLFEMA